MQGKAMVRLASAIAVLAMLAPLLRSHALAAAAPTWTSPNSFRLLFTVHTLGRERSFSPAAIEVDFHQALRELRARGSFDEATLEVVAHGNGGLPRPFDREQFESRRHLVPWRLDKLFGSTRVMLNFVLRDNRATNIAVYFDAKESGHGRKHRQHFPGMVGDGDLFSQSYARREISASHFDHFFDFDGDGDLDLFKGGVEPFVYCYENVGGGRFEPRGRLTSGGTLFTLPKSEGSNRSWVTVAFHDWDGDGQPDLFPSFQDGPAAGRIIFYRNTTREHGGVLTFDRIGLLATISGTPIAGGAQAGGWFPSITFVTDWDGDGDKRVDVLVGSKNQCWLHRNLGRDERGFPKLADAVPVQANGTNIVLINPRFDVIDVNRDGLPDLFAATQPGPVWFYKNIGTRKESRFAAGVPFAWTGRYLIGDAHSGVKLVDWDFDGMPDLLSGRFWERSDLDNNRGLPQHGGWFKNLGPPESPLFERRLEGGPFIEGFLPCDMLRQNSVRAGRLDNFSRRNLFAGDTDGFLWRLDNRGTQLISYFREPELPLREWTMEYPNVSESGGHARFEFTDWDGDGLQKPIVADGSGKVTFFPHVFARRGTAINSVPLTADGKPIQVGVRASVLVCDWDNDGLNDLVLASESGFQWHRNIGTARAPELAAAKPILFGGKPVKYVRPNLGSFVDWDGDGKRDFIAAHFENSIRLYRNIGSGARGAEPEFADPEGEMLLRSWTVQMISGVDVVDWNGDGKLDILTGQGHGGSGLRFYSHDFIEDERRGTHPVVKVLRVEKR